MNKFQIPDWLSSMFDEERQMANPATQDLLKYTSMPEGKGILGMLAGTTGNWGADEKLARKERLSERAKRNPPVNRPEPVKPAAPAAPAAEGSFFDRPTNKPQASAPKPGLKEQLRGIKPKLGGGWGVTGAMAAPYLYDTIKGVGAGTEAHLSGEAYDPSRVVPSVERELAARSRDSEQRAQRQALALSQDYPEIGAFMPVEQEMASETPESNPAWEVEAQEVNPNATTYDEFMADQVAGSHLPAKSPQAAKLEENYTRARQVVDELLGSLQEPQEEKESMGKTAFRAFRNLSFDPTRPRRERMEEARDRAQPSKGRLVQIEAALADRERAANQLFGEESAELQHDRSQVAEKRKFIQSLVQGDEDHGRNLDLAKTQAAYGLAQSQINKEPLSRDSMLQQLMMRNPELFKAELEAQGYTIDPEAWKAYLNRGNPFAGMDLSQFMGGGGGRPSFVNPKAANQ